VEWAPEIRITQGGARGPAAKSQASTSEATATAPARTAPPRKYSIALARAFRADSREFEPKAKGGSERRVLACEASAA
jgi:hypothetical protein